MAASTNPTPREELIRVAIARAIEISHFQETNRPTRSMSRKPKIYSIPRVFDLLTTAEDLPPGKQPRITSTMNQDQIVAAMLSDMRIENVNMNRDLDLKTQTPSDAMINVSAPVFCSMSTMCYLYVVLFVLCTTRSKFFVRNVLLKNCVISTSFN